MIGAIIGDIVGSRFEFDYRNHKSKEFNLFHEDCEFTDDTVLLCAVAKALLACNEDYSKLAEYTEKYMRELALKYKNAGYGGMFCDWMYGYLKGPYNSFGNGAAMRVCPVAYFAKSLDEVKQLSYTVTAVTHNHPEGIKGAEATAVATYMALQGSSLEEIRDCICKNYYKIDFTLDQIRPTYHMDETCQNSVPQALEAFFESISFEDAIRNAISIGGDSDTIGAITGSVAGAYYGVPADIKATALEYLDDRLRGIVQKIPLL
jgi:type I restriction enzyme M protein